ncbi:hypothetical protein BC826DRAFT_971488 [Russula brevipes]|nr:hypothetical protein BC826DRAFT_971488 [Russula brevipes]
MPKRPADDADADVETAIQATRINDDDWMNKLLEVDQEKLILIVSKIVNEGNIDNRSIKKARIELPSFSMTKWIDFAKRTGLSRNPTSLTLQHFSTPVYQLPPSFHKAIFESSWRTQDVYQEVAVQTREESAVRILDPYIVPILSLFHGRVITTPEEAMPASAFSTGGEVEHEIVMFGGILFFVIEAKLGQPSSNHLAQLLLELLSAAKVNEEADFKGLRVYDGEIFLDGRRDGFSSDMIHVTNKIFGLVLFAFIEGFSFLGRYTPRPSDDASEQEKWALKSRERWELALRTADECRLKFLETVTTIEDMEVRSTEALELLTKR